MKHDRKVVIHSILTPEERIEEDAGANNETSDGIRNRKMNPAIDTSISNN